jgi:glutamate-1-semialdehyde 2,1-aminomutase
VHLWHAKSSCCRAKIHQFGSRRRQCSQLQDYFQVVGKPCNLIYATRDQEKNRSQAFRSLFMQETVKRGLLMPSLIVSFSHTDEDIGRTVEAIGEALYVYRKALNEGVEKYLVGRSVKPFFRSFN